MKEFKLPELGENIDSAKVVNVLIKKGNKISQEQIVLEIETDKATIEVPSSINGIVTDLFVKNGDKIKIGQILFKVDDSTIEKEKTISESMKDEKINSLSEQKSLTESEVISKSKVDFKLPELGENIQSAQILKVLVKSGDFIKAEQIILEIETDKATIEVPSNYNGKVVAVFIKDGDKVSVRQTILRIETSEKPLVELKKEDEAFQISNTKIIEEEEKQTDEIKESVKSNISNYQMSIQSNPAPASPSVRRLARELGVDINLIPPSAKHGRISIDDVKMYVKKLNESKVDFLSTENFVTKKQEQLPDFSKYGKIEKVSMTSIRQKVAEHLSYAWESIPMVTQFDEVDITELEILRKEFSKKAEANGVKVTVTSILVKIISEALKLFPQFNSSIDMKKNEIIYKKYYNIGVAVDTENGLMVVIIKNADSKTLIEISSEISQLANKARNRKISLDEMQGGCFTISNLGGIGGTAFTPIVNSPEVAILGVSKSILKPIYKDGQLIPRLILPLSLTYDHRIIDGADGIRFLGWIIEALENPLKLL